MRRIGPRRIAVATFAFAAFGCGGESSDQAPTGQAMVQSSGERETASGNRLPFIVSFEIEPEQPRVGERVFARVRTDDADGEPVVVGYRWSLDGKVLAGGESTIVLPRAAKGSVLRVTATPSDGRGVGASITKSVEIPNNAPLLTGIEFRRGPNDEGVDGWWVEGVAEDADGDTLEFEYAWYVNDEIRARDQRHFPRTGLQRDDEVRAEVSVNDGELYSETIRSAAVRIGNAPPDVVSTPPGLDPSGVFRYRVEAIDPDGDRGLRYSLEEAPDGMEIDAHFGEVLWQPRADQAGSHPVRIVVDDRKGGTTVQGFKLSVNVADPVPASPAD